MSYRRRCILPDFEKRGGLITAVVVGVVTGARDSERLWDILMVASVNETAYRLTLETGLVHFYSQSRANVWKKGETSGNVVPVFRIRLDCDRDAVIYYTVVTPNQVKICHLDEVTCFRQYAIEDDLICDSAPTVVYSVNEVFVKDVMGRNSKEDVQ